MSKLWAAAAIAVVFGCASAYGAAVEYEDMDGDGTVEAALLRNSRADGFSELCVAGADGGLIYCSPPAKIWKLLVADADNDGKKEVAVALVAGKKERAGEANGLHIFKWDGSGLAPVWRGSALSMPFRDVAFADWDGDGRTELLSLEINPADGGENLVIYLWTGFGFGGEVIAALPRGTSAVKLFANGRGAALWSIAAGGAEKRGCALSRVRGKEIFPGEGNTARMEMDCRGGGENPADDATAALDAGAARREKGVAKK